jgi:hypothetical protein
LIFAFVKTISLSMMQVNAINENTRIGHIHIPP